MNPNNSPSFMVAEEDEAMFSSPIQVISGQDRQEK